MKNKFTYILYGIRAYSFSNETSYFVIINIDLHSNNDTHLIAFNASSQLSLKLTPSIFPSWRAQLMCVFIGYNL